MIKLSILTPVYNQEALVIRALDSIPRRDDIEIIVCDDGSSDRTLEKLKEYAKGLNMTVLFNKKNKGVAATANKLLAAAKGEYFHFLMSDDRLDTLNYSGLIDRLYDIDVDILAMDLQINSGEIWVLNEKTDRLWCAQACRFIRREVVKGIKYPENVKVGEDAYFHEDMMARKPSVEYSGVVAYLYNFPREGSLLNLSSRGLI